MKVALVHNYYQEPGGEDQVFLAEAALLESRGHVVTRYTVHNRDVAALATLDLAQATIWNREQYRRLRTVFRDARPDVVHVHNTLPLISPAVYAAAKAEGAAVVQTLHNYRLVCPSGLLFRDGAPCELCLRRTVPFPAVLHACYRASRAASGAVAAMLVYHRLRGTYRHDVDRYIALTGFAKAKFVEGGMPPSSIVVKPNFLPADPGTGSGNGRFALFVGRLSPEKGLMTLLDAWRRLAVKVPLLIVGDGPLARDVATASAGLDNVTLLGRQAPAAVMELMKRASMLVVPSRSYETFGLVAVEAFGVGTPVVASRLGALAELVDHERTGLLFSPGDATDLASAVQRMVENPDHVQAMRAEARLEYESTYSADVNYDLLLDVYGQAMAMHAS